MPALIPPVVVDGVTYVPAPEVRGSSCTGCAFDLAEPTVNARGRLTTCAHPSFGSEHGVGCSTAHIIFVPAPTPPTPPSPDEVTGHTIPSVTVDGVTHTPVPEQQVYSCRGCSLYMRPNRPAGAHPCAHPNQARNLVIGCLDARAIFATAPTPAAFPPLRDIHGTPIADVPSPTCHVVSVDESNTLDVDAHGTPLPAPTHTTYRVAHLTSQGQTKLTDWSCPDSMLLVDAVKHIRALFGKSAQFVL